MAYGPAELIVVRFPGNQFKGEIVPALADLIDSGTIRLIDLLFLMKDADGSVTFLEAAEVFPDGPLDGVIAESHDGLISDEDVEDIAPDLEPSSSAAVLLFKHLWAAEFTQALRNADGELIYDERIPASVVEEVSRAWAPAAPAAPPAAAAPAGGDDVTAQLTQPKALVDQGSPGCIDIDTGSAYGERKCCR